MVLRSECHSCRPRPPQVPHNGQYLSCCTVVRGMQRNLFVVPREPVGSEEISELEAAAASDPAAKKKLIPLLHVSFGGCWEGGGLQGARRLVAERRHGMLAALQAQEHGQSLVGPLNPQPPLAMAPCPPACAQHTPRARSKPSPRSRRRCASCWPSTT